MNPSGPTLIGRLLMPFLLWALSLRYRFEVRGLETVRAKGRQGLLFLPNHPALGDPVLMLALLYRDFAPRSLADEYQIDRPIIRTLARWLGARLLPNLERRGIAARDGTRQVMAEAIAGLKAGENLLLYPAGHMKRQRLEEVGAASGVKAVLESVPNVRVVLIRMNGVWGSSFSWAFAGRPPQLGPQLLRSLKYLLLNGIVFMPRRRVTVEVVEPEGFPRHADRMAVNQYLEGFYNAGATPNTYVPYTFWERGTAREVPEPQIGRMAGDAASAPEAIRLQVFDQIARVTGRTDLSLSDELARDLGLDSLATAELIVWIEHEFGFSIGTPESLKTVGDVVLGATGKGISTLEADVKRASLRWFSRAKSRDRLTVPPGQTITEVFLKQAAVDPGRMIVADESSGEQSYRDLVLSLLLLKPLIEALPGTHIGIMLPASVGASVFYVACLFAGKIPVMVNWTTGSRNLGHSLDLVGVQRVITARALLTRLEALGVGLEALGDRLVLAEDLREVITFGAKVRALVKSRVSWAELKKGRPPEVAVVLFTSGSESLPKAVPLSHANLLTNVRDVLNMVDVHGADVILGMLPPFHSFGITVTTVLPLCASLRAVYHPNPTEASILARVIETYRATMMVGTPTFLSGIVRVARPGQLDSLRLAVTGAEKCPAAVYDAIEHRCPQLTVLEGYGITECSPIVSVNAGQAAVRYSIGRLMPSVEGAVVGLDSGARVAPGQTGMLLLRGPSVFSGYLAYGGDNPFITFEGKSWYRTGDLVRQTDDGVLFFEGRLKRFVKLGGEMVSLPAIEAALQPHFAATDGEDGPVMAVEALGDQENPEIALFTTREAERVQVNHWLREAGLSPLYHIRRLIRVDAIPVLGTGKTDYRALNQKYV
jgi:acyl-[acyl-carrier-protein]-phospholipid O-acyltransferase/long-chain-fatty-acid--[acyl-carrier-protein] ligase